MPLKNSKSPINPNATSPPPAPSSPNQERAMPTKNSKSPVNPKVPPPAPSPAVGRGKNPSNARAVSPANPRPVSPANPNTSITLTPNESQMGSHVPEAYVPQTGEDIKLPDEAAIREYFNDVDQNRSGKVSALEVRQALRGGNQKAVNIDTLRMLMNMFDADRSGLIDFQEFKALYVYSAKWAAIFGKYDKDGSGAISFEELKEALTHFGYKMSDKFFHTVMGTFCGRSGSREIEYDNFLRLCVLIHNITENFKQHSNSKTGKIELTQEQFAEIVIHLL